MHVGLLLEFNQCQFHWRLRWVPLNGSCLLKYHEFISVGHIKESETFSFWHAEIELSACSLSDDLLSRSNILSERVLDFEHQRRFWILYHLMRLFQYPTPGIHKHVPAQSYVHRIRHWSVRMVLVNVHRVEANMHGTDPDVVSRSSDRFLFLLILRQTIVKISSYNGSCELDSHCDGTLILTCQSRLCVCAGSTAQGTWFWNGTMCILCPNGWRNFRKYTF